MSAAGGTGVWGTRYLDHLTRLLGEPVDRAAFEQDPAAPAIEVLTFSAPEGCLTFCTLGLAHHRAEVSGFCEILLPLAAGWDDGPALLANVSFFAVQSRLALGWGVAVGGLAEAVPEFARAFAKDALYLGEPFWLAPEARRVAGPAGAEGRLLSAWPISATEYEFFRAHGAERFEERFAASHLDPFDPRRPSFDVAS
ncbi:MAG TPA: suppressor of fused domain protein [Anaeromyxobacteraceae bacterium]|nr:suppressor of fused domain protein [Anaeromyxobacteraceae bacterium]